MQFHPKSSYGTRSSQTVVQLCLVMVVAVCYNHIVWLQRFSSDHSQSDVFSLISKHFVLSEVTLQIFPLESY